MAAVDKEKVHAQFQRLLSGKTPDLSAFADSELERLFQWDDTDWEAAAWKLLWPWECLKLKSVWESRGTEIRAEIERQHGERAENHTGETTGGGAADYPPIAHADQTLPGDTSLAPSDLGSAA